MQAITIGRNRSGLSTRTTLTSIGGAAIVATGMTALQRYVLRRSFTSDPVVPSAAKHQISKARTRRQHRPEGRTNAGFWCDQIPKKHRLYFAPESVSRTQGDLANLIGMVESITSTSPASAIALLDFVAQQKSSLRVHARQHLTRLLQVTYPSDAAVASAKTGKRDAQRAGDGVLSSRLAACEVSFLGLIYNTKAGQGIDRQHLANELHELATAFDRRDSQRRQASARLIRADILLHLGRYDDANNEMKLALDLLETAQIIDSAFVDTHATEARSTHDSAREHTRINA